MIKIPMMGSGLRLQKLQYTHITNKKEIMMGDQITNNIIYFKSKLDKQQQSAAS